MAEKKGTIVVALHQEFSSYNGTSKLVRGLLEKGYRVVYLGHIAFKKYVTAQGFEFKFMETDYRAIEEMKLRGKREMEKLGRLRRARYRVRLRNNVNRYFDEHSFAKIEEWLEKEPPDMAIVEQASMPFHAVPFLKKGIPFIGLNNTMATSFTLKAPPMFSRVIPKPRTTLIGYTRNLTAWLINYGGQFLRRLGHSISLCYGYGIFSYSKAYLVKKSILKQGGKVRWWEYGGVILKLPEIVLCPEEIDYPFADKRGRIYAGTCVDTKRAAAKPFNWKAIDEAKPLIYCSIGSHPDYCKDRLKLFHSVIDALEQRPHLQLILQIGDKADRESLYPVPDNVVVVDWVPQLEILAKASLFITHGGLSSIREGAHAGTPMIVFPWGVDQPGNGARVVFHHLGLTGKMKKATPKMMGKFIDTICNDSSYQRSAKEMQKHFREQESCRKGIDFIEEFFSKCRNKTAVEPTQESPGAGRVVIEI